MSPVNRILSCLLAGWLLTTTVGCATLNLSKIDFRSRKASVRNPVVKIVCLWEPAEGRDPKGVPTQGFAGRILFLNRDSLPVSVDGDVRIYQFDNLGSADEQAKPIHQFDFESEPWAQHYSYGTLGPCYNVFIPYMRKGASDSTCSMRLRLTPKDGPAVFSEMTAIELFGYANGNGKKPQVKSSTSDSRVEQTTPEDLTAVNKRRRTTTIALDSKGGAMTESAVSHESSSVPKVQQAGYQAEDDVKPLTQSDAKIAQLEQMVRELQAMQGVAPAKVPSVKPAAAAPSAPPRLLEEEPAQAAPVNPGRIKVRSVERASVEQPAPHRLDDVEESHPATRETVAPRAHPLEDEAPIGAATRTKVTAKKRRTELVFEDEEPRQSTRRHPLDYADDEEPAKPAPRKTIRAVEVSPRSDADSNRSDNPFDPIDTNQMETSSVDVSPTVRMRLRAVNQ